MMAKTNSIVLIAIGAVTLLVSGCSRTDALSVTPNGDGTAVITDALVGKSTRIICVEKTVADACHEGRAVVVVHEAPLVEDVSSDWRGNSLVEIIIAKGKLVTRRKPNVGAIHLKITDCTASSKSGDAARECAEYKLGPQLNVI